MTTKTFFARCLTAAGLCASVNAFGASSKVTFSDSWKDSGGYDSASQMYEVKTTGSASVAISLPSNGVDLSEADDGTMFTLSIGPAGNAATLISDFLGNAENYVPGDKSAKFVDIDPNTGKVVGSITVSWNSTTISVTGSASEDVLGMEEMFAQNSAGIATNMTLDSSITGSYYEVSLTLDASDNGGGIFSYDNPYISVTGNDRETEYNAPDGSGTYPLESGSISGAADFTPPKLTITSPSAGSKVYEFATLNLEGTASDIQGITNVQCVVNGNYGDPIVIDQEATNDDSFGFLTNSVNWTAEVDLSQFGQPGANVITMIAQDLSGNQTMVTRTFYWVLTNYAVVNVNPPGAGTIKGIANGQLLQVNSRYLVTATPASESWIFSEWIFSEGTNLPAFNLPFSTFEYYDFDGTLTANFLPNPFYNTVLAGTYTGLFYDATNSVEPDDAGYITMTVKGTGAFSGKLYLAATAAPFSFSGQLVEAPGGTNAFAEFQVKAGKSKYLDVVLLILTPPDPTNFGLGLLGGSVNAYSDITETNLIDSAEIEGALSRFNSNVVSGLYNVTIQPGYTNPAQGPGGNGWGSVTLSKEGAAKLVLNLPDGTSPAISFSSTVAVDGSCPIYASLYGGKGVILGWLQFAIDGSGTMPLQNLAWVKLPVADKFYTGGFTNTPSIIGSAYLPPKAGTNLFGATALTLIVDQNYAGLSLPDETDDAVTFNPVKNTFADPDKATISMTLATGAMTGAFYPTGSKTSLAFHGVEIGQGDGACYGFYTDPVNHETGPVFLGSNGAGPSAQNPNLGGDDSSSGAIDISVSASIPPTMAPPETNP